MTEADTRSRILDAAEEQFASKGFSAASLRGITQASEVNLASVHYHFGSKDGLLHELVRSRFAPICRERLVSLDQAEAAHAPGPVPLEEVVRLFLAPVLRRFADAASPFPRLIGRLHLDPHPDLFRWMRELLEPTVERYLDALQRCLPGVPRHRLFLRASFMLGSMIHLLCNGRLQREAFGVEDAAYEDADLLLDELVRYSSAGLAHA